MTGERFTNKFSFKSSLPHSLLMFFVSACFLIYFVSPVPAYGTGIPQEQEQGQVEQEEELEEVVDDRPLDVELPDDTNQEEDDKDGTKKTSKDKKKKKTPGVKQGPLTIYVPKLSIEIDDVTRLQLDRFIAVGKQLDILNRIDIFKPYNFHVKKRISSLLEQAAAAEADDCHNRYLESLAGNVADDRFYSLVPSWYRLNDNKAEMIFLTNSKHRQFMYILSEVLNIKGHAKEQEKRDPQEALAALEQEETANAKPGAKTRAKTGAKTGSKHKILDALIYVNDKESTLHYRQYAKLFARMGNNLPAKVPIVGTSVTGRKTEATVPKSRKIAYTARPPKYKIARLVYSSTNPKPEMVYPSPELFHLDKDQGGFKIVFFKNLVNPYFDCVIKPMAEAVIDEEQLKQSEMTGDLYLSHLIMHRIAHHLGPIFTVRLKMEKNPELEIQESDTQEEKRRKKMLLARTPGKKEKELVFLADTIPTTFPVVEEIKADVLAVHNASLLLEEGLIPDDKRIAVYATYVCHLLEKMRQPWLGTTRQAYVIQLNYLLQSGAIYFNLNTKKLTIHEVNFKVHIERLAGLIIAYYRNSYALTRLYGKISPELRLIYDKLEELPTLVEYKLPETL